MINLERRKNIKKTFAILLGVIMFKFINLKSMFEEKDHNIYTKDNKLMVSIE